MEWVKKQAVIQALTNYFNDVDKINNIEAVALNAAKAVLIVKEAEENSKDIEGITLVDKDEVKKVIHDGITLHYNKMYCSKIEIRDWLIKDIDLNCREYGRIGNANNDK